MLKIKHKTTKKLSILLGLSVICSGFLTALPTEGFSYGSWSEWSETRPADAFGREIESKTQYMYRDKEFKNHTASTLAGWTATGKKWDELSAWKVKEYLTFDDCSQAATTYSNNVTGNAGTYSLTKIESNISGYWYNRAVSDAGWNQYTAPAGFSVSYCGYSGLTHKYESISPTVAYKTRVYGKSSYTRTLTKWWEFWRWKDWNYQWTQPASNANREIKTRTMYRYRDVVDNTAPTGSCTLTNKTNESYQVTCEVRDENSGINRVEFPTWTSTGGQDDIKWVQGTIQSSTQNSDKVYNYMKVTRTFTRSEWANQLDYYNTHIYATDNKGNQRLIGSFNNIDLRDSTPPTVTLNKNPNVTWSNQNVTVQINATDNAGGTGVQTVQYSLDNNQWTTVANGYQLSFTNQGTYTVYAKAVDYSGNWSSVVSTTIRIDKTKPTLSTLNVSHSGWTNQTINISATAADSGGSGFKQFEYRLGTSGNWSAYSGSSFRHNITTNGAHSVYVRGVDHAGNYSDTQMVYAYYDNNAPTLTVTQAITDLTTKPYNLTVKASDSVSSISKVQLPNGNYIYTTSATYFVTQNGTYTFKAWDQAGNTTTKSVNVTNIKPIQDGTESPLHLYYQASGATTTNGWVEVPNNGSVTFNKEGTTTVTGESRDEAGNTSSQQQTTVKIDKTKPTLSATHNQAWTNQNVTVTATGKDNIGLHSINQFTNEMKPSTWQTATNLGGKFKVALIYLQDYGSTLTTINQIKPILESLGATVTTISEQQFASTALAAHDVYLFNGDCWGINSSVGAKLNQLYLSGKSIVSLGNDSDVNHPLIKSGSKFTETYYLKGNKPNHFASDLIGSASTSDTVVKINGLTYPDTKILGTVHYSDGSSAPGILLHQRTDGAQWLHYQASRHQISNDLLIKSIILLAQKQLSLKTTATHSFTATENGRYVLTAYDFAGNRELLIYQVSNIDRRKPQVNINVTPSSWSKNDVIVDIYGTDSDSGVQSLEYELSGATVKAVTTISGTQTRLTISNTGTTTIRARARDRAGNYGDWVSAKAYVDKVNPVINTFTATPILTNQSNIQLKLTASDAHSGVAFKRYRRNTEDWMSWVAYQTNDPATTLQVLKEGVNTFYAQVRDVAGNVSTTSSVQVVYDNIGPTILNVEVTPYYTNFNKIQVKVSAKDNLQDQGYTSVRAIELSNDGRNWTSYNSKGELLVNEWQIPLVNGYQKIYVRAVDSLGNVGATTTATYVVDTVAPTGSITINSGETFVDDEVTLTLNYQDILNGVADLSGVEKIELFDVNAAYTYTIENPTGNTQTVPWVLTGYKISDGSLRAQVGLRIWDRAGNLTTVYSKEVTLLKIVIDDFYLTDVLNPKVYNTSNPFRPLRYPNIPSQPLLSGGNFKFDIHYSYPRNLPSGWQLDATIEVFYVTPNNKETVVSKQLRNIVLNGRLSYQEIIPYDTPVGTSIYVQSSFVFRNGSTQIQAGRFPRVERTKLKIGTIQQDIRELLMFNEVY